MLLAALALASRGLKVFPLRPRDKRPATVNGLKAATDDAAQIERWWREEPQYNLAIATGHASSIFVLDIDGLDGEAELKKIEEKHSPLPSSIEAITGSGRHIYFRWPNRPLRNSASKIGTGLDIRAEGGYVVAPPSVHPSGKLYAWSVDCAGIFAAAPDWLLDIIAPAARSPSVTPLPAQAWCDLIRDGVNEGGRNDSIARLAGLLLRHRVDPIVVLEICVAFNEARCRPPLPGDEVLAVVDSIAAREMNRRGIR